MVFVSPKGTFSESLYTQNEITGENVFWGVGNVRGSKRGSKHGYDGKLPVES